MTSVVADSPLARRDPTMKLLALTVVAVVVVLVLDPVTPAVLYVLGLLAVVAGTRAPARTLLLAHVPFVGFALGVLTVNALSRPGTMVWEAGPLGATAEGLAVGGALAWRAMLVGVLATGFVLSTDGVALVTSLHRHARLPTRVTYALLAGYRMLQELPREWATIQHAHTVRAAGPRRGPRHQARVVFALLVVSVRRGERMAQALESRGLGLEPRTTWRPARLERADVGVVVAVVVVLAAVIAASAAAGTLRGPGALTGG